MNPKKKSRAKNAKAKSRIAFRDLEVKRVAGGVKGGDTSATSGAASGKTKFNEFQITK
jgi:hypothetical protein